MPISKWSSRCYTALGSITVAAALAACGGGDDTAVDAAGPGSSAAVVTLPAVGTSTGWDESGNLTYLVFSADGSSRSVPAVVAYDSDTSNGTVTLDPATADELVISGTGGWNSIAWPTGLAGLLTTSGNAGLICDTSDDSGQVGISGNMVQVTDFSELHGKSFRFNECMDGGVSGSDVFTFNADGSAIIDEGSNASFAVSAADLAAYFSEAGWSVDGGIFKGRVFSHTPAGGQKQYVMVDISDDRAETGDARIKTVALFLEVSPS